jgi:putative transcriptional regulator
MNMERQMLISLPTLGDSNFRKGIVYIDEHNGDGAHGWIINKELEQRVSVKLRKSMQLAINAPIYYGGPVEINQVYVIHSNDIILPSSIELQNNLIMTRDKQIINLFNNNQFPQHWKIIVGHCSWGAGQLESELFGSRTMGKSLWTDIPYNEQLIWNVPTQHSWEKGIEMSANQKVNDYLNF